MTTKKPRKQATRAARNPSLAALEFGRRRRYAVIVPEGPDGIALAFRCVADLDKSRFGPKPEAPTGAAVAAIAEQETWYAWEITRGIFATQTGGHATEAAIRLRFAAQTTGLRRRRTRNRELDELRQVEAMHAREYDRRRAPLIERAYEATLGLLALATDEIRELRAARTDAHAAVRTLLQRVPDAHVPDFPLAGAPERDEANIQAFTTTR